MKILITGINGFVGSNLTKSLSKNNEIYGLDLISKDNNNVIKTYLWVDLYKEKLPEFDAIIHLAGKAHDTKNVAESEEYFKINTDLTKRIYMFFLSSTAKKFIFFSSVKAVVDSVPYGQLSEEAETKPVGPYGESKVKAEEFLKLNWNVNTKKTYILRPSMIHGRGNKGNLNLLYNVVKKGIPWPLGQYDNKRSFMSIYNLQFIIDSILGSDIETGIYNVCDDEPLSTNTLIRIMCDVLGRKPHIWYLPKSLIRSIAKIGTLLHLPLTSQRLSKLTENYVVSNSKIKNALKIDFLPISVNEGFEITINSFKKD